MTQRAVRRPRMRPRFEFELHKGESQQLLSAVSARLRQPECDVQGRVLPNHIELTTCARQCHVWSPRLTLHVEAFDDGTETLCGRFSPHPNVWTGFLTLYATLFMGGVFGLIFGFSQWSLGMTPWGLVGVPVALALSAFAYGAAFIGQGLGAEEMYTIRSFIDDAMRSVREAESTALDESKIRISARAS
jgi:hypothetical protein